MAEQKPEPGQPVEAGDRWDRARDRRHRYNGFRPIFFGLVLILIGVLFFLQNQGLIGADRWWQYFLVGLGIIFLIDAAFRYRQGPDEGAARGRVIVGVILMGIGIVFLAGASAWWPLILIVVGVAVIAGGLWRR